MKVVASDQNHMYGLNKKRLRITDQNLGQDSPIEYSIICNINFVGRWIETQITSGQSRVA